MCPDLEGGLAIPESLQCDEYLNGAERSRTCEKEALANRRRFTAFRSAKRLIAGRIMGGPFRAPPIQRRYLFVRLMRTDWVFCGEKERGRRQRGGGGTPPRSVLPSLTIRSFVGS